MNGAQYIAETLSAQGVNHVFLVLAILRRGLVEMEKVGIKRIVAHSEKGATYMADGYARVSRRPSVSMAQSVGAANLAAGLQDAFLAHSPVIALTGRKPPLFQYRNAYQELLHGPMFDQVTKYNANIDDVEQLPFVLQQLFREATTGAPRPVHADLLGLSGEIIEAAEIRHPLPAGGKYTVYPAFRPAADPYLINEALALIKQAKRPIIVAGGGSIASDSGAEVLRLAEALSMPVATSNAGKGIIPESHPLAAGVVGSYSQQCANHSVSDADLVLFIGSATGDQVTLDWTIPAVGTPVIQIDINPSELGRSYPNALGVYGDAKTVLQQMLAVLKPNRDRQAWTGTVRGYVGDWHETIRPHITSDATPIRPERLCYEIGRNLPKDAILAADTGYSCVWASTMIPLTQPTQRFIRAAGSLGWAFPAALGAKCAAPDRPVICFSGDGAFLYHLPELETARRWGINTVTIVNNNSCFGQSITGIKRAYGTTPGNPDQVLRFEKTNYARIAEDFGCMGIRVEDPAQIAPALQSALKADKPAVIDVVTGSECHPPALWKPAGC
ncbi:MAG: thiamine pyrophosphate-binding protein [Deltaproteobacteria bacterium]|nr:thiamine pyrophosphate-binding protein [Deltaproteobacteria bacterium]